MPVDSSIQAVLQKHSLVTVAGWDHAAVHEVELDELGVGQVEVHCDQLTAAALSTDTCRGEVRGSVCCDLLSYI